MKMLLLLYLKAWERLFSFILLFCYFFLVTCDISLFSRSVQVTKNLPPSELTALSNFYISLNGPNWHWFNESATIPWNFSVPNPNPCLQKWQGLSCNCLSSPSYCYLDEINLPLHNLSGIFPQSVGTFTSLTRLALLRNNITGSIPTAVIANLTSLTTLDLRNNLLYGPIPWNINKIANLQVLSLENNFFEGPLPRNLFRLKALKALLLQYNMLNGTLSSAISDLKQLQELALSLNHFTGTLPIGIGNLTHLQDLEIKFNRLHGPIPRTIGLLTNLSNLAFSGNNLSQSIPFEIGNLTQLKSLNLDQNRLTGSLPGSLGNLTKLFQLYINNNLVFGSLPVAMFNSDVKVLTTVSLGSNLITGKLPSEISHWARTLQFFSLSRNRMTGSFPTESFSNASLRVLSMNFNFFYGAFPNNSFPNGTVLIDIDIGGNSFSGSPPSNHWPVLAYYLAYDNYFDGVISPLFHTSSRLYYFEISHNFLTGIVPDWVSRSILLTYLNFTDNLLTGPLNYTFSEITHATHLQQISLGHNFLTGTIPRALGRATTLVDIILNDNQISGTIPQTFRDLRDLEVLFLQNNHISGNLYNFRVYSLVNFDVSNNQLTGTLPDFTFIAPSLKTFAASSNCIDGTISDNICTISSFTLLALDGLSTATKCRTKFFPSSRFFNGFYVNSYIKNGIPDCLFTMPNLQTLQLSGNGLTGSLPSNMNLSNSLTDLSLSHNQLTGTIPLYIQEREWTNLDLSYNKLGGILSNDFHSYDDESSLSLEINRLSGNIPNVLRSAQNINILQGNLFTCNSDRSALPSHDKSVDTYSCGSDIVNATIYLWLGVFFIFLVMLNLLLRGAARLTAKVRELQRRLSIGGTSCHTPDAFPPMPMVDEVIHNIVQWRKTIAEFQDPDENVQIAVQSIRVFLRPLRRYAVRLAFFVTVVLTPIYLALTLQYRSYYYSYAWSISAVFVSGRISAITMCVPLIVLIFIAVHFYRTMVENPSNTVDENYRTSRRFRRFLQSIKNLRSEDRWLTTSVLILVGAINFVLMLIVDVVYVYIVLTYSTAVIILTEACLAMFKLWFNNQLLWKAIPWAKMRLKGCFQVNVEQRPSVIDNRHLSGSFELSTFQTHNPMISSVEDIRLERAKSDSERSVVQESSSASSIASRSMTLSAVLPSYHAKETVKSINAYTYSLTELIFIMVTIVFNNVLLPMLAIFIVNPDCFFNSLFAASTETVSYNYVVCDRFSNLAHLCLTRIVLTEDSSYTPPFIYGYQCASNVLTNYIPVFIIMFTFEGFLHPLLKIILKLSSDKLFYQEYFLKQHQSPPNPLASLKPLSVMEEGNNAEQKEDSGIKSIAFNRFSTRQVLAKSSPLYRLVIFLLPANMQDLTPFPPNDGPPILFDKNRLAVKINSALVVLIAFGAPFPPLAIIICVSLITLTLFEEIVIGRLLFESQKLGYLWYKKQIERDCYGIAHTLKYTLWSLVPVSSLLFAYIIFDTWGDQEGWASALPATIITGILPIIYLIFVKYYDAIVEKVALLSKQKDDLDANNDEVALHEKKTDVTDESGGSLASRPLPTLPANILDELIRTDDEEITNSPSLGNNELSIQSDHDETKNSPLPSNRNLDCQVEDV